MPEITDPPRTQAAETSGRASATAARRGGLLGLFDPAPPAPFQVTDPTTVRADYKRYQREILIATMIGYAVFYMVRKNLSIAMPVMLKDPNLGMTKESLGTFLTIHGLLYGVSKFANGYLGDRSNARVFMVTGLLACALINFSFALSASVLAFGFLWLLNGWFQGMGFPPCARLLTHWFPPKILATRMSVWNTSHSIGAAAVAGLGGYLYDPDHAWKVGWQAMFYLPAIIAVLCAVYLWFTLKDTPESLGLPPVESIDEHSMTPKAKSNPDSVVEEDAAQAATGDTFSHEREDGYMRKVFTNPYIWIIALANFFVYTVRYAIFDWSPTIFNEAKGFNISEASWITTTFELSGIVGMLAAGWITDNVFGGRGARTCLFYMAACAAAVFALWKLDLHSGLVAVVIMSLAGFFIYGPQALVGIAVANLATKHAAATAVGITGVFGYLSGIVSGWGIGKIAQNYGWSMAFEAIFAFAVIGTVLFALAWFAPAHGYKKAAKTES